MILGIDYSGNGKPHAYAVISNHGVEEVGSTASIEQIFRKADDYKIEKVYFEMPFSKHNKGVAMELAKVTARIEMCCEERGLDYAQFPGANWQAPIKTALGVPKSRPVGISEVRYRKMKYRAYRIYAEALLRGKRVTLTDDEVAAICIGSHGLKLYNSIHQKTRKVAV